MNDAAPTTQWRSHAPDLPPLVADSPADSAERLLLLVHYCIDWETSWVAEYRRRYWDHILPSRIRTATYRSNDLYAWWSTVSASLGCSPQNSARRREITELIAADPAPVLSVLRDSLEAMLLRVRIIAEAVADARSTEQRK